MKPQARDRLALLACLALAAALLCTFVLTPAPKPASAPATDFSAARALRDVAAIAREPHPVGSAANRRVRDRLIARMAAMGLSPQLRTREGLVLPRKFERPRAYGATVDNIVGVLPGRDRAAPALTLMAHYDSVAASPGAGDDASGVAAALEVARALKARGVPARDVMLVFTDGEEAGLLGAEAFFAEDPLSRRVGPIINLETRGGGGRAAMFETGKNNGGLVRALSGAVHAPLANSAAVFAYRQMPNSTDFTPAQAAGKTGYNFAFLGRQFDYHAATSTPANLDKGSLQSLGDEVLPLAARLAFGSEVKPAPDLVFSQVVGSWIVAYPPVFGWAVLLAAALLIGLAYAQTRPGWRDLLIGVLSGLAVLLLAAALLHLARLATGIGFSFVGQRPLLARFGLWEAAMLLLAASPVALLARFCRNRMPGAWIGLLLVLLLTAVGLQLAAPLAAYLLAWPLLLASVLATGWIGIRQEVPATSLVVLGAAFGLAWVLAYAHFLSQAVDLPAALAVFVLPAAALLWPLTRPLGFKTAAVLFMTGLALVAFIRLTSPWSPRHPQATGVYYVAQPGKGFFRAAPASLDGPWLRKALGQAGTVRPLPPLNNRVRIAPAPPVAYQPLTYGYERRPDGMVRLSIPWRADLQVLAIELRVAGKADQVTLNGRPAGAMLPANGKWASLTFWPSEPLELVFRPAGPGRLEFRYAAVTQAWPRDAAPLPPRAPTEMRWMDTDALAILGEAALDFP